MFNLTVYFRSSPALHETPAPLKRNNVDAYFYIDGRLQMQIGDEIFDVPMDSVQYVHVTKLTK